MLLESDNSKKTSLPTPKRDDQKVVVSRDGRLLVFTERWREVNLGEDAVLIHLVDLATGSEIRTLANFPWIADICLSPDGKLLAACGKEGLRIWGTSTGSPQASFQGHRGDVTKVAFSPDGSTLVSSGNDGTMVVWDVATLLAKPPVKDLSAGDLNDLWEQLAARDAKVAGEAMHKFNMHPQQAVLHLARYLQPVAAPDKEAMAKYLGDLGSEQSKVREKAQQELAKLGELAEPALRESVAAAPSLEHRLRVQTLLKRLDEPMTDGDKLRMLRSIEILESAGTAEAVEVLRKLAGGAEGALVTRFAKAAWARRKTSSPTAR